MSCLEFVGVIVDTDCLVVCARSYTFSQPWDRSDRSCVEMLLSAENRFELINEHNRRVAKKIWWMFQPFRHHEDPILRCSLEVGSCQYSSCDAGAV